MELIKIDHIISRVGKSNVRTYIQEKMIIVLEIGNNSIRNVVSSSDTSRCYNAFVLKIARCPVGGQKVNYILVRKFNYNHVYKLALLDSKY
jgi:hypothetical protein